MPRLLRRTCAGVVLVLALVLLERGARADPPSQDIAALSAQVEQLWSARKYAEALSAQEKALAATEKAERASSGKPGVATGSALHNVAFYALFARHHSRALAASERARKLAPNELSIETNQAHALMFLGRLQAARNLYRAHQNKRFPSGSLWQDEIEDDFIKLTDAGLGHSLMPTVLQEFGIRQPRAGFERNAVLKQTLVLNEAEKFAEALPVSQRYAALVRERYGDNHIRYADAISLVGRFLFAERRRDEGLSSYRRALEIAEHVFGADNVAIVPYLDRLAAADGAQAIALGDRVLDIAEKNAGTNLPQLLRDLKARAEAISKHPAAALRIYERAFALAEKGLPPGHPDRIEVTLDLAREYYVDGRKSEAFGLHEELLSELERSKGVSSPEFHKELAFLANLYRSRAEDPSIETRRKRILETYESKLGSDDPDLAHHVADLAMLYTKWGRHEEAEPLYERALPVAIRYAPQFAAKSQTEFIDRWVLEFLGQRADMMSRRGLHAEAITLRKLIVSDRRLDEGNIEATLAIDQLAREYVANGDWGPAAAAWRRSTSRFVSAYRNNSKELFQERENRDEHG